jgi:hypothetical protein
MCSGVLLAAHIMIRFSQNILHPKVWAAGVGLFVSATTEPLRVGVRVVADMASRCQLACAEVAVAYQWQDSYMFCPAEHGYGWNIKRCMQVIIWSAN